METEWSVTGQEWDGAGGWGWEVWFSFITMGKAWRALHTASPSSPLEVPDKAEIAGNCREPCLGVLYAHRSQKTFAGGNLQLSSLSTFSGYSWRKHSGFAQFTSPLRRSRCVCDVAVKNDPLFFFRAKMPSPLLWEAFLLYYIFFLGSRSKYFLLGQGERVFWTVKWCCLFSPRGMNYVCFIPGTWTRQPGAPGTWTQGWRSTSWPHPIFRSRQEFTAETMGEFLFINSSNQYLLGNHSNHKNKSNVIQKLHPI